MPNKTICHSCFSICSAGEIVNGIGLAAGENGIFEPDDITEMLGIQPFDTKTAGTPRKIGYGEYAFSEN